MMYRGAKFMLNSTHDKTCVKMNTVPMSEASRICQITSMVPKVSCRSSFTG